MFLALKEVQRAKVRFALLVAAVALLVFLILFQQTLQGALLRSFTGAIRNQSAPVLVYSVDGQRTLQASVVPPPLEAAVRSAEGVGEVGRIGASQFTVRAGGELVDATVLGYEREGLGSPSTVVEGRLPGAEGEVVASDVDAPDGFAVGDTVTVEPGGLELTVVGLASDAQLNVGPTLFATYATYGEAVRARNPDAGQALPNALAVAPAEGTSIESVVAAVNEADPTADALSREDAATETPGVAQVRQSFQIIFGLYGIVVPCVTGLFFLIVTFQKAGALTLLRAVGAPGRRLVESLLLQVVLVVGTGIAVGTLLYLPVATRDVGGLTLRFETGAVLGWSAALLVLGLLSALVAARRVLRIDPADATGGQGVGG